MIQSLNQEINLTEADKMLTELEQRIELSCIFAYCASDRDSSCGVKGCGSYLGSCNQVSCGSYLP